MPVPDSRDPRTWRPGDHPPPDIDNRLQILEQRMEEAGYPVRVVSKGRSAAKQADLYAQGRSRPGRIITEKSGAPGDESRHQLGQAADFAFTAGRENWDLLGQTAKELGLEWGGDWKSLVDKPHVQLPKGGVLNASTQSVIPKGGRIGGHTDPASVKVTNGPALAAAPPPAPPSLPGAARTPTNWPAPSTAADRPAVAPPRLATTPGVPPTTITVPPTVAAGGPPPAPPSLPAAAKTPTGWPAPSRVDDPTSAVAAALPGELRPASWEDVISGAARKHQVNPQLALALARTESSLRPAPPDAGAGAVGLFQLMPATAARLGVDPNDPAQNIEGGVRELKRLLDENQGDIRQALRLYKGSPTTRPEDVDPLVDRVFEEMLAGQAPAAAAPAATPARAPTGAAAAPVTPPPPLGAVPTTRTIPQAHRPRQADEGGFLNSIVQGLDPHEVEGRRNIGGAIGGALGGFAGSVVPVWGTAAGGIAGAALGGYMEQMLVEETGLGDLISNASWLPGKQDVKPTAPPPNTNATWWERTRDPRMWDRADDVALWQAVYEVAGQGLVGVARFGAKKVMGGPLGEAAKRVYEDLRKEALEGMHTSMDGLKTRAGELLAERTAAVTTATEAKEAARRTAAGEGADLLRQTDLHHRGQVTAADVAADEAQRVARERLTKVKDTQADLVEQSRQAARAAVEGAETEVAETAEATARRYAEEQARFPLEEAPIGKAVSDVYEGPAMESLSKLGRAVDDAVRAGKPLDSTPLQQEAERLVREELLPPAEHFPSTALPDSPVKPAAAAGKAAGKTAGKDAGPLFSDEAIDAAASAPPPPPQANLFGDVGTPDAVGRRSKAAPPPPPVAGEAAAAVTPDTPLTRLIEDIGEARYQELVKHPAMSVIRRILSARGKVPPEAAHEWLKQLDDSLKNTFDKTTRSYLERITLKLRNTLRESLGTNKAYGAAAKTYADNVTTFREGLAKVIRGMRRKEPGALIQRISPDRPQEAKALVEILTTHAGIGGREAAERTARAAGKSQLAISRAGAKGEREALAAGREALEGVRGAWLFRNVMEGDLAGLPGRIQKLKGRPEFIKNFLGDVEGQAALKKLEEIAAEQVAEAAAGKQRVKDVAAAGAAELKAARTTKRTATRAEESAGRASTEAARGTADAAKAARQDAVETARRIAREKVTKVKDAGDAAIKTAKTTSAAERRANVQERIDLRAATRRRAAGTQEEIDFVRSSLGKKIAGPEEAAGNLVNAALFKLSGRGWWRLLMGAKTKDMVKYLKVVKEYKGGAHGNLGLSLGGSVFSDKAVPIAGAVARSTNLVSNEPRRRRERRTGPPPPPPARTQPEAR